MNSKKVLIITLYGNANFGNKLQNYALEKKIKNLGFEVETLAYKKTSKSRIKNMLRQIKRFFSIDKDVKRTKEFIKFNSECLNYSKKSGTYYKINKKMSDGYDYYIYGSDQIWNPYYINSAPLFMGELTNSDKNIAYAASFGISLLPDEFKDEYEKGFNNFKYISLREKEGKEIVDSIKKDHNSTLVIDPTMLLSIEEWNKIIKKPTNFKTKKYILNCFLGEISLEKKQVIFEFANKNNCDIIDIYDNNSPFYNIGPREFLYLEKNAYLICTDSFHSSVFAILFDRPFIVFERESKTLKNMYSRIDNLLNKFKLVNRKYNGKCITDKNLEHDYKEAYKILEEERKKSEEFLKKALDIKEN